MVVKTSTSMNYHTTWACKSQASEWYVFFDNRNCSRNKFYERRHHHHQLYCNTEFEILIISK